MVGGERAGVVERRGEEVWGNSGVHTCCDVV